MAKVFDTSLREHPVTLHGHVGPVNSLDFSPDNESIATGSEDGTVRLWHTREGQQKRVLFPPMDTIFSVAFAPEGRHLVIGGIQRDGRGRFVLYELNQGRVRHVLHRHLWSDVEGLDFHPVRPIVATAANDREIILWDMNTREKLRVLPPFDRGEIAKMAIKPGETPPLAPNAAVRLAFSPDGEWLAVVPLEVRISNREAPEQDLAIKFWRWESGQRPERPLKGHQGNVTASAFDPSGERFVSGDVKGVTCVWRLPKGERESKWEESDTSVIGTAWSADGSEVVVAYNDGRIRVHDPATGAIAREIKIDDRLSTLASAQESGQIVVGAESGQIYVVNLVNLTARRLETAQRADGLTPADYPPRNLGAGNQPRWPLVGRGARTARLLMEYRVRSLYSRPAAARRTGLRHWVRSSRRSACRHGPRGGSDRLGLAAHPARVDRAGIDAPIVRLRRLHHELNFGQILLRVALKNHSRPFEIDLAGRISNSWPWSWAYFRTTAYDRPRSS